MNEQPEPMQEPWSPNDTANRIGGLPQDFIMHEVENEGDWSEWVNPNSEQYFIKCCDCGLVHEMQLKVAKYSDGDECEFVDDPDLQPMFRARRATPPAAQPASQRSFSEPKRSENTPWVGLTDEERAEVADVSDCFEDVVDATEAKMREKNGYGS
jgi:hypothetical protein